MQKVLVTGGAGFVGSRVVAALSACGAEPVALVRRGAWPEADGNAEVVEADFHDAATMGHALRRIQPSALVHAAWQLAPGTAYLRDPANLAELSASLQLFALAEEHGCKRIVGIGTCLEYEPSDRPAPEGTPLRPQTLYGASKAALFIAAQAWAATAGVSFAWARLYFPFGPGEAPHRLIPSVVNALLRGERVATTAGLQRRSFLFVDDAADAVAAITLSGEEGAFNVGSDEALSVREVVARLAASIGQPDLLDIGALEQRPGEPDVLWADTTRLRTNLKWRPRKTLDEGLEETIAWWRTRAAT